jgi:N-dimethylarginine dimethylaminohydrolase
VVFLVLVGWFGVGVGDRHGDEAVTQLMSILTQLLLSFTQLSSTFTHIDEDLTQSPQTTPNLSVI